MNKEPAVEEAAYAAVDDALRTYPLAPAPATLSAMVLSRVSKTALASRFGLTWQDYALSLLTAGMIGLALLLWQSTPAWLVLRLQQLALRWSYYMPPAILWTALISGAGLVLAVIVASSICLVRPRFRR